MCKIFRDLKKVWNSLCLSTKILTILCFIALSHTILTIFFDRNSDDSSDEAIRSVMVSILGYIFGETNATGKNIGSKRFRIYVAGFVAFITILILIFSKWFFVNHNSVPLTEFKNILFAAIGFLASMSKALSDLENKKYLSKSNKDDVC